MVWFSLASSFFQKGGQLKTIYFILVRAGHVFIIICQASSLIVLLNQFKLYKNTCPTNGHNQKQMYIQTETITFRQENTQSSNTTNTTPNFYNCFRSQHTVCVCHTHKHIHTKTNFYDFLTGVGLVNCPLVRALYLWFP